jgi:hypothetical protein
MQNNSDVDTAFFGRVTCEPFESFWPHVAQDPNAPPELLVFATSLEAMTKVVFTGRGCQSHGATACQRALIVPRMPRWIVQRN